MSSVNNNQWVVLKYGGTSVSSLESWETIKGIVKSRQKAGFRPLVVCSALSGISDKLEELLDKAIHGGHEETLKYIENRHRHLAKELGVDFRVVEGLVDDLSRLIRGVSLVKEISPRLRAELLAYGELMSTKLGAAYLGKSGLSVSWLDAREHLESEERYHVCEKRSFLLASCPSEKDDEFIKTLGSINERVLVTQGFIGRNSEGQTVLFGRGGSDVSASYFAAKLGAVRCEIWTDVP